MGFFDFLKKKKDVVSSVPDLEVALENAAKDEFARVAFYKALMNGKLLFLTDKDYLGDGEMTLQKDTIVKIQSFDNGSIPVFTSTERIFDKGVIAKQVHYMKCSTHDLFEFTKGATLILNPFSDYGKEFVPDEIQGLLDGTIFNGMTQKLKIEMDTTVQMGQPSVYPTEVVNALQELFRSEPSVNAGYLGWVYYPKMDDPAHYIFGIDVTGDVEIIIAKTGRVAQKYFKAGEFADIIDAKRMDYFRTTTPFYQK